MRLTASASRTTATSPTPRELAEVLIREDRRHLNTTSDSEVLLNVFASELQRVGTPRVTPADVFAALNAVYRRCRGGYAVVAMVIGHGILGFRDPNGIRPLVLGRTRHDRRARSGCSLPRASRSPASAFKFVRDVGPGEAVFIDEQGRLHLAAVRGHRAPHALHLRVRLLRASRLDHRQHLRVPRAHAHGRQARREDPARASRTTTSTWSSRFRIPAAPAPCSSRSASASNIAKASSRTATSAARSSCRGRSMREKSVRRKLNAIDLEFRGKNVLLVDDSIVRGTTSAQIIDLAREAGAKKVYFASAAPPVRFPNVYGIDMPAASELVAAGRSVEEVARADRRGLAHLPGPRRSRRRLPSRRCAGRPSSIPPASPASTSPATSRRSISSACRLERSDEAKTLRREGRAAEVVAARESRAEVLIVRTRIRSQRPAPAIAARAVPAALDQRRWAALHARRHLLRAPVLSRRCASARPSARLPARMVLGAHDALGASPRAARCSSPKTTTSMPQRYGLPNIEILESAHPVPDERSLAAGERLLRWVDELPPTCEPLFLDLRRRIEPRGSRSCRASTLRAISRRSTRAGSRAACPSPS